MAVTFNESLKLGMWNLVQRWIFCKTLYFIQYMKFC